MVADDLYITTSVQHTRIPSIPMASKSRVSISALFGSARACTEVYGGAAGLGGTSLAPGGNHSVAMNHLEASMCSELSASEWAQTTSATSDGKTDVASSCNQFAQVMASRVAKMAKWYKVPCTGVGNT